MHRLRSLVLPSALCATVLLAVPACNSAELERLSAERDAAAVERDAVLVQNEEAVRAKTDLESRVAALTADVNSARQAESDAARRLATAEAEVEERVEELEDAKGTVESHRDELLEWVEQLLPLAERQDERLAKLRDVTGEIQKLVEEYRGLSFEKPLMRRLIHRDDVKTFMRRDAERDMPKEEADKLMRVLAEFGVVPPGTDLYEINEGLMEGGALAFYNPLTSTFYLIEGKNDRGDRPVVFHELVHALEDQHFDLAAMQISREDDTDAVMAIKGLIEGSAERLTNQYGKDHAEDVAAMMAALMTPEGMQRQAQMMLTVPPFLMASMAMFPYKNGAHWLKSIGVETNDDLNAVYSDPPVSTEQVLHPEKYRKDFPHTVAAPAIADVLGEAEYEVIADDTMGELFCGILLTTNRWNPTAAPARNPMVLMAMLDQRTEGVTFRGSIGRAAAGWDGDRYTAAVSREGDSVVVAWASVWDTDEDAQEFAKFYASLVGMRVTGGTTPVKDVTLPARFEHAHTSAVSVVEAHGNRVSVVLSAPPEVVDALVQATRTAQATPDERETQ